VLISPRFEFRSEVSNEFHVDQSVSHNGVCLTVTRVDGDRHFVTAVEETLKKSNLGEISTGDKINIERCMIANGRFDGHIVQGHVDTTAKVTQISDSEGSWYFDFELSEPHHGYLVEKGSICINGVSLTCFDVTETKFRVAIIPYTYEHTNFNSFKTGQRVNIEFDIIGKYVKSLLANQKTT
jgi:riboflavin synthase